MITIQKPTPILSRDFWNFIYNCRETVEMAPGEKRLDMGIFSNFDAILGLTWMGIFIEFHRDFFGFFGFFWEFRRDFGFENGCTFLRNFTAIFWDFLGNFHAMFY